MADELDEEIISVFPNEHRAHFLGQDGVTSIVRSSKSGMYSDIPYIQGYAGDVLVFEYCQHNIEGIELRQREEQDA